MECYDWMVRLRNWNITFLNWLIRMLSFFFEPCNDNDTNEKRPQRRFTDLSIDVVVHGDVGVRDVNLHVEIRDVLDPRVVAVPHQRLHGNDCVNWNEILLKTCLKVGNQGKVGENRFGELLRLDIFCQVLSDKSLIGWLHNSCTKMFLWNIKLLNV